MPPTADARPLNPKPPSIMNSNTINEDPLKLHELVVATAIVVAACASVAVCFTTIATCQFVGDTLKRIRRKGGRHAP